LGWASLTGPLPILIALVSFALLIWFKVNSTWLVIGGGVIGLLSSLFR
jgi:chromate transporter